MQRHSPAFGLLTRPIIRRATKIGLALTALSVPGIAHAQAGGIVFRDILLGILASVFPLWIPVAILIIVIAGMVLVVTTQDEALTKGRTTLIAVGLGGMIIMLGPVVLFALYQAPGITVANTAPILNAEALGIVDWLSAIVGIFGILMVMVSAVKAVGGFGGNEQAYSDVRQSLLNATIGMIIITASIVINNTVFSGAPNPIIVFILTKALIVLNLMTTVAVGILVYAGVRMVANFGNEEYFTAAKSLAIRVLGGLAIMLVSYVLVFFVGTAFN